MAQIRMIRTNRMVPMNCTAQLIRRTQENRAMTLTALCLRVDLGFQTNTVKRESRWWGVALFFSCSAFYFGVACLLGLRDTFRLIRMPPAGSPTQVSSS